LTKAITEENTRRVAAGQAALPLSSAAERKSSIQTIMQARLLALHLQMINAAKDEASSKANVKAVQRAASGATDAQLAAALTALTT